MQEAFAHISMIASKSEIAAMIASAIIEELVSRSNQAYRYNDACPYCDIAAIGYYRNEVQPLLHDSAYVLPITALNPENYPIQKRTIEYITPDNHLELVTESYREWIEPKAAGITPMADMFHLVTKIVTEWCNNENNRESFPPIIFNITDRLDSSEYDENFKKLCNELKQTGTQDGNTLIFNICIDSAHNTEQLAFPSMHDIAPNHPTKSLAQISSLLPEQFYPSDNPKPPYLGICYNTSALSLLSQLRIVTQFDNAEVNEQ